MIDFLSSQSHLIDWLMCLCMIWKEENFLNIILYVGHQCIEAADWNFNW